MDVLISGGSVAGPALAYWLARHGFRPTLVESAPSLREGGYAIDLRGAAMEVADRMGIGDDVRLARTATTGLTLVDVRGGILGNVRTDHVTSAPGDVEIKRGDLAGLLYRATKNDTEYVFGDSIASLAQGPNGVDVTFKVGAPRRFDLVIGADGTHSNVRRLTFGAEAPFIRHLGYYASVFTIPNPPNIDSRAVLHNVPGKLAAVYHARGSTQALLAFAAGRMEYDHRDEEMQRRLLERNFAGMGWEVPRLLKLMRQAPDFYFDEVSQVHLDGWSRGRVSLVGDAGYAASFLSGQGTTLAMVGAYVLADSLRAAAGDHQAAFARYERVMRDFVTKNQAIALSGAPMLIPKTRSGLVLRNAGMRLLPYIPGLRYFSRNLDAAANAITLDAAPPPA